MHYYAIYLPWLITDDNSYWLFAVSSGKWSNHGLYMFDNSEKRIFARMLYK